jgi:broad specificity phosphatase PhoE
MSTPPTLLLIRHGQTSWNALRRVLGRTDIPLDATGCGQAVALGSVMGEVDRIYSSPLIRARATAELAFPGRSLTLIDDFTEMDQGELEGLESHELGTRFGPLLERWNADPGEVRLPGGETMNEVRDRALLALGEIAASARPGERVAVVTHQLVLSAVLTALAGEPTSAWRTRTHGNTHWSQVSWGSPPTLQAFRLAPHLPNS